MKKVILGSAFIIGGILLVTLSMLVIAVNSNITGLPEVLPYVGIALFILGCVLAVVGLGEDDEPAGGRNGEDEPGQETEG